LIRLKEGRPVTIDLYNDTDTPEQLHWHGQMVPLDVNGAASTARRSFRRTDIGGLRSHRRRQVYASTTRCRAPAPTFAGQYGGQVRNAALDRFNCNRQSPQDSGPATRL
jgi:hypothetical protein